MADLQKLDVVITRPQAQAELWAQALQARGARTYLLPVMEIVPVAESSRTAAIKTRVMSLADYDKVVFVSRNAVQYAMEWVDRYWPQLPLGIEYFAVGSATADAARGFGLQVTEAGEAMNSEALLELPGLNSLEGKKVLIFRGVGGRNFLSEELRARGARVDFCELYHRLVPPEAEPRLREILSAWASKKADRHWVIAVHSGEGLHNLTQLMEDKVDPVVTNALRAQALLLVPGARVAELAASLGYQRVLVAVNATDAAMTQALVDSG